MTVHHAAVSLPGLCRSLLQIGIGLALQSTLLLGLGLLAGWALRRRGPALASLLYRAALIGTLLGALAFLGLGGGFRPLWRVSLPPAEGTAIHRARLASVLEAGEIEEPPAATPGLPGLPAAALTRLATGGGHAAGGRLLLSMASGRGREAPAVPRRAASETARLQQAGQLGGLYVLLVGVWAAGALALLMLLLLGQLYLGCIRRNSQPAPVCDAAVLLQRLGEAFSISPPLLLVSPAVRTPFLAGIWRSAIFLPAGYEREFDPAALRAILAHELVHLARRDCAWNLLAQVIGAVGWMQPLLWVLGRKMAQTSEAVCDEEVVRREGDPRAYADCLLRLSERLLPTGRERLVGVGVVPFRSSLGRRIHEIMEHSRPRALTAGFRALVAVGAGSAVVIGSILIPGAAAPSPGGSDSLLARGDRRQRSALEGVPELEKPVTYTETKVPLNELVQKISAETGMQIAAAADVADEPVAVAVREMPARELLEQVAELLDYQWARHGKEGAWRYEIWQDLASKQREQALGDALIAEVVRRFQEELKQYADVAALPADEFQRLVVAAEKDRQEWDRLTAEEQSARLGQPGERERRMRFGAALALQAPVYRATASLTGRLNTRDWSRLLEEGEIVFATEPRSGESPLPAETDHLLRSARPTLLPPGAHLAYPDPVEEEKMFQQEKGLQAAWAEATGFQVTIRLDSSRLKTQGALSLTANALPFRSGAVVRTGYLPPVGGPTGTALSVMTGPRKPGGAEEDTPERRAALESDPVVGVPKLLRQKVKPLPNDNAPGAPGWWRLWDLLPDLARAYDVQFIADSYWTSSPGLSESDLPKAPGRLFSILDRAAGSTHRWDHVGRLIRLRSRTWFLDRPREVPLRLVRRWREQYEQLGALPLREYTAMASVLSDAQLLTLDNMASQMGIPGDGSDFFMIHAARHGLRLYSSLGSAQRQWLWSGKSLPITQMSPSQRALYFAALSESKRGRILPSDLAQAAEGTLSLKPTPFIRVVTQRKGTISLKDESLPQTGAGPVAVPVEALDSAGLRPPAVSPEGVNRCPVTRLWFVYQGGPQTEERNVIWIATPHSSPAAGEE